MFIDLSKPFVIAKESQELFRRFFYKSNLKPCRLFNDAIICGLKKHLSNIHI
jgi:hypothetical protein